MLLETRVAMRPDTSMRVPSGARMCICNDPRLDLGEVIAPEEEEEGQGSHRDRQRDFDEGAAMGDHLFEQQTVALAELIEAAFEPLLKADEDVPRWFRAGLPVRAHAASTW